MTVLQHGQAYAFEQVDREAARGQINIVPALQKAVDFVANRPMGGRVTIGTPRNSVERYPWSGILDVPSNVELVGIGMPRILVTSSSSRMFRTEQNSVNTAISDIDIDTNDLVPTAVIDVQNGFRNFRTERIKVRNAESASSAMDVVRIGSGSEWRVEDVDAERARYLVWNGAGANDGYLMKSRIADMQENGGLYRYAGGTRRTWILDNQAFRHLPTVVGGHMIQGDGENNGTEEHELWIMRNLLEGNPGVSWNLGVANGAAADMIAVRNTKMFMVCDNILRFGGEFGITAVHGSRHGLLGRNLVEDMDGSAISLGSVGFTPPRDVDVMQNRIRRPGLDHSNSIANAIRAAIHIREADECNVWLNRGWQCPTYGLNIHTPQTGPPTVTELTHGYNLWKQVGIAPVWDQGAAATPITPNWTQGDYSGPVGNLV